MVTVVSPGSGSGDGMGMEGERRGEGSRKRSREDFVKVRDLFRLRARFMDGFWQVPRHRSPSQSPWDLFPRPAPSTTYSRRAIRPTISTALSFDSGSDLTPLPSPIHPHPTRTPNSLTWIKSKRPRLDYIDVPPLPKGVKKEDYVSLRTLGYPCETGPKATKDVGSTSATVPSFASTSQSASASASTFPVRRGPGRPRKTDKLVDYMKPSPAPSHSLPPIFSQSIKEPKPFIQPLPLASKSPLRRPLAPHPHPNPVPGPVPGPSSVPVDEHFKTPRVGVKRRKRINEKDEDDEDEDDLVPLPIADLDIKLPRNGMAFVVAMRHFSGGLSMPKRTNGEGSSEKGQEKQKHDGRIEENGALRIRPNAIQGSPDRPLSPKVRKVRSGDGGEKSVTPVRQVHVPPLTPSKVKARNSSSKSTPSAAPAPAVAPAASKSPIPKSSSFHGITVSSQDTTGKPLVAPSSFGVFAVEPFHSSVVSSPEKIDKLLDTAATAPSSSGTSLVVPPPEYEVAINLDDSTANIEHTETEAQLAEVESTIDPNDINTIENDQLASNQHFVEGDEQPHCADPLSVSGSPLEIFGDGTVNPSLLGGLAPDILDYADEPATVEPYSLASKLVRTPSASKKNERFVSVINVTTPGQRLPQRRKRPRPPSPSPGKLPLRADDRSCSVTFADTDLDMAYAFELPLEIPEHLSDGEYRPSHSPTKRAKVSHSTFAHKLSSNVQQIVANPKIKPVLPRPVVVVAADSDEMSCCHQCRRTTNRAKMRCTTVKQDGKLCGLRFCGNCVNKRCVITQPVRLHGWHSLLSVDCR